MKRLVMLMSLLLSLGGVVAAEGTAPQYRYGSRGYFGTARANVQTMSAFWFNDPAVGVDIINGYSFNPWFMLGGGVGFIYTCVPGEGAVRIPIYLHLRANVLDRKVTPFFALNLGGGFCKGYQHGFTNGAAEEPNGHSWVLDGFMHNSECLTDDCIDSYYLHCNFGWGGKSDGWYFMDLFNNETNIDELLDGGEGSLEQNFEYDKYFRFIFFNN